MADFEEMVRKLQEMEAQRKIEDAKSMPTLDEFQGGSILAPETKGYNAFMSEATRAPGSDTPFMQALRTSSTADKALQGAQLRNRAASDTAAASANLAERGGLSSGAAERMSRAGNANLLNQSGIANSMFNKAIGEGMQQDETRRVGMLSAAPGAEQARAEYTQGATERASNARNLFNANKYNQQMSAWSANKLGDAQKSAAESSGK